MRGLARALPKDVQRDLERLVRCVQARSTELDVLHRATSTSGSEAVIEAIGHWVYQNWYCAQAVVSPAPTKVLYPDIDLSSAFRAALPGSRRWQQRWTVVASGKRGSCVAGRRGEARELRGGEYASVFRPGLPVAPGDGIAVMDCLDWIDRETGFWATRSKHGEPKSPLLRLYLSPTVDTVCPVLTRLTTLLDSRRLRYSLKCPFRPADFERVDSLVVYLERAASIEVRRLPATLAGRRPLLRQSTPPLTRRIGPGIAVADEAGPGESFGQNRCRALAAGIADSVAENRTQTIRAGDLAAALRRQQIDPRKPWIAFPLGKI
jgi:hypothetical protein